MDTGCLPKADECAEPLGDAPRRLFELRCQMAAQIAGHLMAASEKFLDNDEDLDMVDFGPFSHGDAGAHSCLAGSCVRVADAIIRRVELTTED